MNYKALAAGAVLGFLMAVAPACGDGEEECGTNNCAGCCTADGVCTETAAQTVTACGASGNACVACAANQTCVGGACVVPTQPKPDAGVDAGSTCAQTCNGCCTNPPAGGTPICLPGNGATNCGSAGATCQQCTTAQVCSNNGSGFTCSTPDAGNQTGTIGAACTQNSDCTSVNSTIPMCKTETTFGNKQYADGYCTRRCYSDSHCGSGSICIYGLGQYGEGDNICVKSCTADTDCRTGYSCVNFGTEQAPDRACWLGPPYDLVDAGAPIAQGVTGSACADNSQCQPGSGGFCTPESLPDGGLTGYPGGECSSDCTYGGANFCGTGGTCVLFLFPTTNAQVPPQDQYAIAGLCQQACANAPQQDVCRTGYYCSALGSGTNGYCSPRCDAAGGGCPSTYPTCNANGQCCNSSGQCL